ncbi:putative two-component hybrid sensor and regulator [Vibrio halioticoli NBRC 102217]|uniref:histidine kinase n=1 Tax=Vibrio halioticoli NBRC 102217 TaxID=1219072 RepID=V5HJA8_9VIBR|nr:ATP-binding protein [Vibrio halioticoli]GAD89355.1 putative two-component hybrid sensor and regulator [Vibrio halioticoli NBRC 102217]
MTDQDVDLKLIQRKLAREMASRKQAESLLEQKSLELFETNQKLELAVAQLEKSSAQDILKLEFQQQIDALLIYFGRAFLDHHLDDVLLSQLVGKVCESSLIKTCYLQLNATLNLGLKQPFYGHQTQINPDSFKLQWRGSQLDIPLIVNREKIGQLSIGVQDTEQDHQFIEQPLRLIADLLCRAVNRQQIIYRNIESRKKAEQSERATRDFLAMINHELRTPLNGLLGSSELLQGTELDDHQQDLVENLSQSGEFLRVIINDLLDYSKINADMFTLLPRKFEIRSLLKTLSSIFNSKAQERALSFHINLADDVPCAVEGDMERITQIFVNLIGNAVKFTDQGSVTLNLGWNNGQLQFQVIDTGIGISPKAQKKLFQPFTQVDRSSKRSFEGTGLGLAICNQLIQLMGGSISLQSTLNVGTTFTGQIPLRKVDHLPSAAKDPAKQLTKLLPQDLSVLVVDDIRMNQIIIKEMLAKLNIVPDIANNGLEAVTATSNKSYSMILMDCRMPTMDGFEATQKIRDLGMNMPIIALTASTTLSEREMCFNCGMDDVLTKPYRSADIQNMLVKWCKN